MGEKIKDTINNKVGRFWVQYFFFSVTICVFQNFLLPYLQYLGYNEFTIGIVLSTSAAGTVTGQFINGYLSDKFKTFKIPLMINLFLSMLVASILIFSTSFPVMLFAIYLLGITLRSMYILIDTWILNDSEKSKKSFSTILTGASIGRVVCSFGLGFAFLSGYEPLPFIYIGLTLISIIVINSMRDKRVKTNSGAVSFERYKNVITNGIFLRTLLLLMVFSLGMFACKRAQFTLLDEFNAGSDFVGIFNAALAFFEAIFLFIINRYLKNIKPPYLTMIGGVILLINLVSLQMFTNYYQVLFSAMLYAGTFAFTLIGAKYLIALIAPAGFETTGQAVGSAVYMSSAVFVTGPIYGFATDTFGVNVTLLSYLVVMSIALVGFTFKYFGRDIKKLECNEETGKFQLGETVG